MLGVGLKWLSTTRSAPELMPASTPPALFEPNSAFIVPNSPLLAGKSSSLFSLPRSLLAATPAPISTAFTPFILIIASAILLSSLSYIGSPSPAKSPFATLSTLAPTLSPLSLHDFISSFWLASHSGKSAKISLFLAFSKSTAPKSSAYPPSALPISPTLSTPLFTSIPK